MADITFDQVVQLAEQLDAENQNLLIYRLRVKQMQDRARKATQLDVPDFKNNPIREALIHEVEKLRTTPARPEHSLLGKYANPNIPAISEEEFHAQMHAIATEWEQELDEFNPDDD